MKYRIRDIAPMANNTINPQSEPNTTWHLYSLPSFDKGKREEVLGSEIKSNKFIVPHRCILFNKLNVRFKRVWCINSDEDHLIASTEFLPLVPKEEFVDYDYFYQFLTSDQLTNYFNNQNSNTSGSHKRIDVDSFLDMEIELPSLSVQKQIGQLISINDIIALNTRMIVELETMAKQLYDYWFVQFDFPDENGKPYKSSGGKMVYNEKLKREIPEGWEVSRIENILSKVVSTPRLITDEYLDDGAYPIIDQTTDIYFAGFTNRKDAVLKQYPVVVFGDHSCAVKYVNFPFARGADGTQIMFPKNKNVSAEYLYFYVMGINISKGYARHYGFIKDYPLIIPFSSYANKYRTIVEPLFTKIKQLKFENIHLTHLRDSLLPMLMNGQVTVE